MTDAPLTPGKRDPARRRRAIIHAATEIIVADGPAALTHRAVAAHAGVALGSTTQYFSSIDELREAALNQLAEEIDESLAAIEPFFKTLKTDPTDAITELLKYLDDPRAVHADIALMSSGINTPSMQALALRWSNHLIDMLSEHIDRERAEAIAIYLDGATMHAGLRGHHPGREAITRTVMALAGLPMPPTTTPTTENVSGEPKE
ncbi:TetR/AcrR family transcriptional regulator [Leucobacter komagatae]|uniref:TetR family transcriptional regulator n=1 Tax=Leucobacter komagatae TaxID=55969 RepID=A0A0D0ITK9_9MICO|nr:TetR family transcriptional regulator [Leucobacter komagatae]KIP52878.1 TetR family transcriptional regulator [Leucobacter komagatae]